MNPKHLTLKFILFSTHLMGFLKDLQISLFFIQQICFFKHLENLQIFENQATHF